ncbi:MAG: hypothetical protein Q4A81_07735 [Pasteurellaceae bacterium]|nr:hypothetical protein [Pasteurellaceae bacterium]
MTPLDLSLFTIFKQLLVLDKLLLKDNANLSAYRQRSQLLQQIGCYALAIQDHRVIALLEQQDDIDKYNSPYHINDYVNQFVQQFSL